MSQLSQAKAVWASRLWAVLPFIGVACRSVQRKVQPTSREFENDLGRITLPEANDESGHNHRNGYDDLHGKTAVVTGSSSGIGRAIACRLAEAGAAVLVHGGTREEAARRVSRTLRDLGVDSDYLVADLSTVDGIEEILQAAWNWREGVDIWINNAGADVLTGAAGNLPFEEKLHRLWQVDVLATIQLSRSIGRRMRERSETADLSVILNVGWDQAQTGMGGDSGEMFAASKGAIMAFTKSLAKSLAPQVRVNCIAPGWIKTGWGESASNYWQQRASRESLLGRWGTPEDVAHVAHFLVSPGSAFVTGEIIPVNGGFRTSSNDENDE